MKFAAFFLIAAAALPGCQTLNVFGGSSSTIVRVSSEPEGAVVTLDGYGSCETPCTVEIDKPREAKIGRAGYNSQNVTLTPGKRSVKVTLELSAPTTKVDETAMPEL
ncbi:MAG: PEGA domain-containing protein [Parvularculaceae bacterium]|nr:PEGA domain-containing protein [Parvularculaceae bacterium]